MKKQKNFILRSEKCQNLLFVLLTIILVFIIIFTQKLPVSIGVFTALIILPIGFFGKKVDYDWGKMFAFGLLFSLIASGVIIGFYSLVKHSVFLDKIMSWTIPNPW